jgi:hypothetical protein
LLIKGVWACSEDMKARTITERRGFMAKERAVQRLPNSTSHLWREISWQSRTAGANEADEIGTRPDLEKGR